MSERNTPSATELTEGADLAERLEAVAGQLAAADPASVRKPVRVTSHLTGAYRVSSRVGDHEVVTDQSAALGGDGSGPSPVNLAIAALGSCQAMTYRMWALKLGIRLDEVTVVIDAMFDARGLLGVANDTGVSPHEFEIEVTLRGPDQDRHEELRRAVNDHCPVLDLVRAQHRVITRVGTD